MDKVRIGIVGVGGRGRGFAKMAFEQPGAELAAVADPNHERAERALATFDGEAPIYDGIEALLDADCTDALVITTPDYQHAEQALKALEAGQHLLVDKPIAITVEDSLAILQASREHDAVLYMGFNLRHHAALREAKRLVAEKHEIGKPFHLVSLEYYNGGRTYMSRWNRLKKYTGGLFIHKGTHDFDVLNWINQPARPAWVSASAAVNVLDADHLPFTVEEGETVGPTCHECDCNTKCPDRCSWMPSQAGEADKSVLFDDITAQEDGYHKDLCMYLSDKDTHDNGMAIVEYDNGSRAFHNEVFVTARSNREYKFIGDLGHMEVDLGASQIDLYPRWTKNKVTHRIDTGGGGHGGSDPSLGGSFIRSIQKGERPVAGAIDGVWSLAVGVAAEIAREETRVVHLNELLDPDSDLLKVD